ncbi:branched-chain amino acid transport system II carrier protein [Melissococcus plutonius]|uniref:Branched-chain amino acid transport system carrier protein n=1 Tax=Melissococcus plutonius (strain ATCC 35311 / DSM 29964 / CIP 104052 / LMG 20360 / NCIMB 702443) TaxID=940190 RepID=F3Y837_MELPT|nr:branched-chain amino acid transport system II carrier protein [Melissococcus plutonius]KMT30653.1 branched-chain amino acid transport system carrier protein BrnQ [Melissococcus plutonius]KMT35898.1 branched-chain amino acid transport system carrier protein BrnQ [Melissococcus plutonius]MBB5177832.1 LIVCS family branched-chain amino acid:cation transporter [Melissococcus plutonius]BAK20665.1 branched-chain amino acid transport system carrier protein [Melissococcus plutonius ATCC 35311]BBD145
MKKKLTWKNYLYVGSMLFGLFFGAGNLIFPVHLGQEAGAHVFSANLGFLVTGIGLPFLGILVMGISQCNSSIELAERISRPYALIFTFILTLTLGPLFTIPRLATTSFEIGLAPFFQKSSHTVVLAVFSVIFFLFAWLFSKSPSKLLDYIGKFLNPLFLFFLAILLILAFIHPLGNISSAPIGDAYSTSAFFKGFTDGYNTLDALGSFMLAVVIISTIRGMGVTEPKDIAKDTIKSGIITVILMGVIYTLLAYVGTMSVGHFAISSNGGIALTQIATHYLGNGGLVLLATIVILACLKTAIGLITACSETFMKLFSNISYKFFILSISIFTCLFANVGLTNIIQFSLPVLMFLYPLTITLMLLALFGSLFNNRKEVYQITTLFTFFAAFLDMLNNSPAIIRESRLVVPILEMAEKYLPLFSIGMGWTTPAAFGFILGILWIILPKYKINYLKKS